jgi:hypothetical protein
VLWFVHMPAGCPQPHVVAAQMCPVPGILSAMSSLRSIVITFSGWFFVVSRRVRRTADAGMSTAEYAVGTVAAVAFAVVLYKIVRSPAVSSALSSIVQKALHAI